VVRILANHVMIFKMFEFTHTTISQAYSRPFAGIRYR